MIALFIVCGVFYNVVYGLAFSLPSSEYDALVDFYISTNGNGWAWSHPYSYFGYPWNVTSTPHQNPCNKYFPWQGVHCTSSCTSTPCHVQNLTLSNHLLLTGKLPSSIGNLTFLMNIDLSINSLTGTIPTSITNCFYLQHMDFHTNNKLNGSIPLSFGNLTELRYLSLSFNRLTGSIPHTLGNLIHLEFLGLYNNQLIGHIPSSLGNLSQLQYLQLFNNALSKTLPSELGNLLFLEQLMVNGNQLTGSIPDSLGNLINLQYLNLYDNLFSQTIPNTFYQLKQLQNLDLCGNTLTGTIPYNLGNLTNLIYLALYTNRLHGTIPFTLGGTAMQLQRLLLHENMLTHTLPDSIGNLPQLQQLNVSNNDFTGTVPDTFQSFFTLQYLDLSYNLFSGTVPVVIDNTDIDIDIDKSDMNIDTIDNVEEINMYKHKHKHNDSFFVSASSSFVCNVVIYNIRKNVFSGIFPTIAFCACNNLQQIDMTENILSGIIPSAAVVVPRNNNNVNNSSSTCFALLALLQLSKNQFTGNLPEEFITNSMQVLYLDENAFSGSIPINWFDQAKNLQQLCLAQNCLSGTLPDSICTASGRLEHVSLDGLHSKKNHCVKKIIPWYSNSGLFAPNLVEGSLPACLFQSPKLVQLQLSGNAFTGTLPSNLSNSLKTLILANNRLSGTIPLALWYHKHLTYVDLSFNRFQDTFPSAPFPLVSQQQQQNTSDSNNNVSLSYYLQNNRLSGTIPSNLQKVVNINILEGNQFSCQVDRKDLPYYDPQYNSYDCGSDETNTSIIVWIVIVGGIICFLVSIYWKQYFHNKNHNAKEEDNDNDNESTNNHTAMKLKHNKNNYCLTIIQTQYTYIKQYWNSYHTFVLQHQQHDSACSSYQNLIQTHQLLIFAGKLCLCITLLGIVFLLPIYSVLNLFYRTHDYPYIWVVSSSYLSGRIPAIILCILYLCILICISLRSMFYFSPFIHDNNNEADNDVNKESQLLQNTSSSLSGKIDKNNNVTDNNKKMQQTVTKNQEQQQTKEVTNSTASSSASSSWSRWCLVQCQYFTYFTINAIVVCGVNMAYVYIVVVGNYNITIITIASVFLSIFKLVWNKLILGGILYQWITEKLFVDIQLQGLHFLLLSLFNNIMIPYLLAQALVSPTCFLYAIQLPPVINIYMLQFQCTIINYIIDTQLFPVINCSENNYDRTTYYPSFTYTYQCSSSLVSVFAHVFVYRYLLSGILLPLLFLGIQNISCRNSSFFPVTLKQRIRKALPVLWRLDTSITANNDDNEEMSMDYFVACIHRVSLGSLLIIEIMTSIAMMLTFGISFPLLMIIIAVSVMSHILSFVLLLGRWIHYMQHQQHKVLTQLLLFVDIEKLREMPKIFAQGLVLSIGIAAMFLSFSLFDILGDDVGAIHAYWIILVMCLTLLTLMLCFVFNFTMKCTKEAVGVREENNEKPGNSSIIEMEVTTNPILAHV